MNNALLDEARHLYNKVMLVFTNYAITVLSCITSFGSYSKLKVTIK